MKSIKEKNIEIMRLTLLSVQTSKKQILHSHLFTCCIALGTPVLLTDECDWYGEYWYWDVLFWLLRLCLCCWADAALCCCGVRCTWGDFWRKWLFCSWVLGCRIFCGDWCWVMVFAGFCCCCSSSCCAFSCCCWSCLKRDKAKKRPSTALRLPSRMSKMEQTEDGEY